MSDTSFSTTPTAAGLSTRVPAYSWYALAVLTAVYVLNFLDRTLIYLLFTPIKKEMAFSDLQLALLGPAAFAIFYTALGIPFGWLADVTRRKYIIGVGLAVWSLFSGLTGFAHSFWTLFFCRVMVGVGEATLGPAALSLLSDYFPPRMRATVQSVYSSGIAIGGGLAFFLGGLLGQHYGWRWAFYLLGFPGLVLALLVFLLKEEPRGRTETVLVASSRNDWTVLFTSTPLLLLYAGYALFALSSNNLGIWVPTFFVRVHSMSLLTIGTVGGILSIVIGVPLTIAGGYFADRARRGGSGGRMAFGAGAAMISVPLWLALLFTNQMLGLLLLNIVLYGLAIMWVGLAAADVHDISGPNLRGLGIGIFFSIVNLMAYGVGAPLIGRLNDMLGVAAHPQQMRLSLLVCPVACALGAVLLWMGSRASRNASH
jgi:MFS family permease